MLAIVLLSFLGTPAIGAENRHGVGFGFNAAIVDSDSFFFDEAHEGFSVFGKYGVTDNWGIFIFYRDMEDDEDFSDVFLFPDLEQTYRQFGVRALRMWRADARVRPHVAFGLTYTDMEADFRNVLGIISDSGVGISVSGGFEAGSQTIAFFTEYSITVVDLSDFDDDDTTIGDLVLGIMFKF